MPSPGFRAQQEAQRRKRRIENQTRKCLIFGARRDKFAGSEFGPLQAGPEGARLKDEPSNSLRAEAI
jgi:hypothetical protein